MVRAQTVYNSIQNIAYFGWLDQYSLSGALYNNIGPEACVPTSATNAMTFLQGVAPSYFGTNLTGSTYSSWIATDVTLASASYMNTDPNNGTYYNHIPYAVNKYIREDKGFTGVQFSGIFLADWWASAPYDKPAYMTDGLPTWNFLYSALTANKASILSVNYATEGGHEVFASGLNWTDANNDGVIQFSENATISFVDPLDPSATYPSGEPGGGAKFTEGRVWNKDDLSTGVLLLNYNQYSHSPGLPYESAYTLVANAKIEGIFTIAVPEPSSVLLVLFAASFLGFATLRRR